MSFSYPVLLLSFSLPINPLCALSLPFILSNQPLHPTTSFQRLNKIPTRKYKMSGNNTTYKNNEHNVG